MDLSTSTVAVWNVGQSETDGRRVPFIGSVSAARVPVTSGRPPIAGRLRNDPLQFADQHLDERPRRRFGSQRLPGIRDHVVQPKVQSPFSRVGSMRTFRNKNL